MSSVRDGLTVASSSSEELPTLYRIVIDFYANQSTFYQHIQHFVTTLSQEETLRPLAAKHVKVLLGFLQPYQQIISMPDFFAELPLNSVQGLEKVSELIRPDNIAFNSIVTAYQNSIAQQKEFDTFLQKLETKYPGVFKMISNQLSHNTDLLAAYNSKAVLSFTIKPMQHVLRYSLFFNRMQNVLKDSKAQIAPHLLKLVTISYEYMRGIAEQLNIAQASVTTKNKGNRFFKSLSQKIETKKEDFTPRLVKSYSK